MFFIVEGTYELTVGDQTSTAGPGTIVFIPRSVVHRFTGEKAMEISKKFDTNFPVAH
jgi:mannose-6-phosphate isomerase-like protein (cupin superfamily)